MNRAAQLTLAHKINRLFDFYHRRSEPQLDTQSVAIVLGQRLGRQVNPEHIAGLRAGTVREADEDLLRELSILFGVSNDYLVPTTQGRDADIDQRLRLWILVRDKGLSCRAARANSLSYEEMEALIAELEALPDSHGGLRAVAHA